MKIYRYWEKGYAQVPGKDWNLVCFGGSDLSPEAAKIEAEKRAQTVADHLSGTGGRYPYAAYPLREELKEEFSEGNRLLAVITRNACGSLVLNTSNVMFIDLDFPPQTIWTRLKKLLGFGQKPEEQTQQRLIAQVEQERDFGMRLYRTANGFRCLVTSRLFDPAERDTHELLERFGCDPLYVRLCKTQECFRARLSPKCWRCGLPGPSQRFPWESPEQERIYRDWEQEYQLATSEYTTCFFVGSYGEKRMHPEAERMVAIHDAAACARSGPLA